MSSCHDVKKGPKEIQDKDQTQKEELDLILNTLEGMTIKFNFLVEGIKNAVSEVDDEVRNGNTRLSGLADEIVTSIQILQDKIISEIKGKKEKCPPEDSLSFPIGRDMLSRYGDMVDYENISFLRCLDPKKSTKVEVIKEIRKEINDLDKTMEVKLKEVVTALKETVKNCQRHGENQDERRENVQEKFHEHEEFIRTNLLELI